MYQRIKAHTIQHTQPTHPYGMSLQGDSWQETRNVPMSVSFRTEPGGPWRHGWRILVVGGPHGPGVERCRSGRRGRVLAELEHVWVSGRHSGTSSRLCDEKPLEISATSDCRVSDWPLNWSNIELLYTHAHRHPATHLPIHSLLHSVNLVLFTLLLVHLILRISPHHSHHLRSHHLSLP